MTARENSFGAWWSSLNTGQQKAVAQKLWQAAGKDEEARQQVEAFLRGELTVTFKDAAVTFVDQHGRCIPTKEVTGKVVDANRAFHLVQPEINYGAVLIQQQEFFPGQQFVSAGEFEERAKALLAKVEGEKQVKNLLRGVHLPFCLPKLDVADYGSSLAGIFLPAMQRSYEARFPQQVFFSYRAGRLSGEVGIDQTSRHHELIKAMADGPVVGVLFPTALQGFGIEADRQMIAQFPPGFALAGAIDLAAAITAYPEVLAKSGKTPALDCAANTWRGGSLSFGADGDGLEFYYGYLHAGEYYSGGVVVFG